MILSKPVQIDREWLQNLKTLAHSALVCLDGMDSALKNQLEVLRVTRNFCFRALEVITALLEKSDEEPGAEPKEDPEESLWYRRRQGGKTTDTMWRKSGREDLGRRSEAPGVSLFQNSPVHQNRGAVLSKPSPRPFPPGIGSNLV